MAQAGSIQACKHPAPAHCTVLAHIQCGTFPTCSLAKDCGLRPSSAFAYRQHPECVGPMQLVPMTGASLPFSSPGSCTYPMRCSLAHCCGIHSFIGSSSRGVRGACLASVGSAQACEHPFLSPCTVVAHSPCGTCRLFSLLLHESSQPGWSTLSWTQAQSQRPQRAGPM